MSLDPSDPADAAEAAAAAVAALLEAYKEGQVLNVRSFIWFILRARLKFVVCSILLVSISIFWFTI